MVSVDPTTDFSRMLGSDIGRRNQGNILVQAYCPDSRELVRSLVPEEIWMIRVVQMVRPYSIGVRDGNLWQFC